MPTPYKLSETEVEKKNKIEINFLRKYDFC